MCKNLYIYIYIYYVVLFDHAYAYIHTYIHIHKPPREGLFRRELVLTFLLERASSRTVSTEATVFVVQGLGFRDWPETAQLLKCRVFLLETYKYHNPN